MSSTGAPTRKASRFVSAMRSRRRVRRSIIVTLFQPASRLTLHPFPTADTFAEEPARAKNVVVAQNDTRRARLRQSSADGERASGGARHGGGAWSMVPYGKRQIPRAPRPLLRPRSPRDDKRAGRPVGKVMRQQSMLVLAGT